MIKFNSSPEPTIGVEIELQLVNKNNLNLNNISSKVLSDVNKEFSDNIKCELIESMIEINTNICSNIEEVEKDIRKTLNHLNEILINYETEINCTSLHPFAIGKNQIITDNLRYKRIMKDLQMVGKRFISQGLHVHIGISNPEDAIKVNNALRVYLPLLLALSTSSPFFEGEDTGLHSYRTKLFEALPLAGMPDYLNNWNHFENLTKHLEGAGIINSVKNNEKFSQNILNALREIAQEKQETTTQEDITAEESIYKKFTGPKDTALFPKWHASSWKDKLLMLDKFEDERLISFGKKIIYQESPETLPLEMLKKIKKEIAERILSEKKEKWWTCKEFYNECDNLREKYTNEKDEKKLKFLDQIKKVL